jgi:hypothetical protein
VTGCLPILTLVVSAAVNLDPAEWRLVTRMTLRGLLPDALLYSAWVVVICAPLVGVSVVSTLCGKDATAPAGYRGWLPGIIGRLSLSFVAAVAPFAGVSAALFTLAWGVDRSSVAFVTTSHAVLTASALSLMAFGGLCAVVWADVLDAAACALVGTLVVTTGVLVAGAPVADAPRALIDAALTASPIVAIASAANIDVIRMDVLYQISPLSHVGF